MSAGGRAEMRRIVDRLWPIFSIWSRNTITARRSTGGNCAKRSRPFRRHRN